MYPFIEMLANLLTIDFLKSQIDNVGLYFEYARWLLVRMRISIRP